MAAQDRRGSRWLVPGLRSPGRGLFDDLVDQAERTPSPDLRGKVLPAGERREVYRLDARVLEAVEGLSPVAGGILLGAIEPVALEGFTLEQVPGGVDSRPILGPCDQAFFATVREEVLQPLDLGPLLAADHDRPVSSGPEFLGPVMEPAGFPGDVRAHVAHEPAELEGVVDVEEEVVVGGGEHVAADAHLVEALGPPEDAEDDLVELPAGPKEETAVEGAAGDLDEGSAVWDKAKWSAHHPQKTENRSRNLLVLEPLGFARGGRQAFPVFQDKRKSSWGACGWARMESAGTSGGGICSGMD